MCVPLIINQGVIMSEKLKDLMEKRPSLKGCSAVESQKGKVLILSLQEEMSRNEGLEKMLSEIEFLIENGYTLSGSIIPCRGKYLNYPLYTATLVLKD